jgi:spoIIIJ-associated protein
MGDKGKNLEFEGASVEEAVKKAIETLKIPREEFEVKIVCEEKRGLFGMGGAKPAKILVIIKQ